MQKKFLKLVSLLLVMSLLLSSFVVSARPVDETEPETIITFDDSVEDGEPLMAASAALSIPPANRGVGFVYLYTLPEWNNGYNQINGPFVEFDVTQHGTYTLTLPPWQGGTGVLHGTAGNRRVMLLQPITSPPGALPVVIESFAVNGVARGAANRTFSGSSSTNFWNNDAGVRFDNVTLPGSASINQAALVSAGHQLTVREHQLAVATDGPINTGDVVTITYKVGDGGSSVPSKEVFIDFLANDNRDVYYYPTGYTLGAPQTIPADRVVLTKDTAPANRTFQVKEGGEIFFNIRATVPNVGPIIYLDNEPIPPERLESDTTLLNFVITLKYEDLKDRSVISFADGEMVLVTFDTQGGSVIAPLRVGIGGLIPVPADPTKSGETFSGWYKSTTFTPENRWDFALNRVEGAMTLYASYAPIPKWTVKFMDGDVEFAVSEIEDGQRAAAPTPAPEKEGFRFLGWFLGEETTAFNFNTAITASLTLNARWEEDDIDVAFVSVTANGAPYTEATTKLTITLDKVVAGFSAADITVTGATISVLTGDNDEPIDALTGDGPVYTLAVSGVGAQWQPITVTLNKSGFAFSPATCVATTNALTAAKTTPGRTISLSGEWKIAPGLERMSLVGGTSTIPSGNSQLSAETRNNNLKGNTYANGRAGAIPAQVPDASAIPADADTSNWIPATVPGSVLGSLMDVKAYDYLMVKNNEGEIDVQFDVNRTYNPNDFLVPWWFSKDFELTEDDIGRFANLTFNAINYTGQVFINGVEIKNKKTNVTSVEELRNRIGTLERPGQSTLTGNNYFSNLGINWNNGIGYPINSVKKGPYTYQTISGVGIPDGSTANRGSWDVWHDGFQGGFRTYELDITGLLKVGTNNIKVKITKGERANDFNYNLHDWHMTPIDAMMGLTYDVDLKFSDVVRLSNPFASFEVSKDNTSAKAKFYVDVDNFSNVEVPGTIYAKVYAPGDPDMKGAPVKEFSADVVVPADVYYYEMPLPEQTFSGAELELWWPYMSGSQPLYKVAYEFVPAGAPATAAVSDKLVHRFGIRQLTVELNKHAAHNHAVMIQTFINHKPIILRGGGYTPTDLYMRQDPLKRDHRAVVDLVKSMGFNMFRDEGKFFASDLYDIMDEEGILLNTGYMCCDRHEQGGGTNNAWAEVERFILYEHTYSQIRKLRSRPSFAQWMSGSDYTKANQNGSGTVNTFQSAQKMYEIAGRLRLLDHASTIASGSGPSHGGRDDFIGTIGGMEMQHSYDTVVPAHYYASIPTQDEERSGVAGNRRGIFGFISEGGVSGGSVPAVESLRRFIPEANLWPYNVGHQGSGTGPGNYNKWNYHAARGNGNFDKIDNMAGYAENAFGGASNLEEGVYQYNLYQYEYNRAGWEALSKHRYSTATGMVNWMMNGVRPTIMWNSFDFWFNPHGSSYGQGKANEPVHIMYDPYGKDITVHNYTFENVGEMTAEMTLYDIQGNIISNKLSKTINVVPDTIGKRGDGARGYRTPDEDPQALGFQERAVGLKPSVYSGTDWYKSDITTENYSFPANGNNRSAQIDPAGNLGLTTVWTKADIDSSLIAPTSDVYFMRLELKDSEGEVVSYNSYAVARRDSAAEMNSGWPRAYGAQAPDWSQLKTLPEVELVYTASAASTCPKDDRYLVQTVTVTNPTDAIAHGVEVKSFTDVFKTRLSPVTYNDNMFTLYPGETRVITVRFQKAFRDSAVIIGVNCYNNVITARVPVTNVSHAFSPIGQTAAGTTASTPNATTNLARNRQFVMQLTGGNYAAQNNITQPPSAALTAANVGTNVLDASLFSSVSMTTTGTGAAAVGGFRVDLGSAQTFDRIQGRWSQATTGTNWMASVPDYVKVEVSNDGNANWVPVEILYGIGDDKATYDNSNKRAMLTSIYLVEPVTARYIRFTLTGLTTASTTWGDGPGTFGGSNAQRTTLRNASSAFTVCGLEVYNSFNYVFVEELPEKLSIATGGRTITSATPAYVYASAANLVSTDRYLRKHAGRNLTLNITSGYPVYDVYLDGEKITNKLAGNTLVLTDDLIKENAVLTLKVPVTSIKIDALSIFTVARYSVYNFSYSLNDGAVSDNIRWEIADPKLGYVDDNGQVTIFDKIGNVRLTATEVETGIAHSITLRIAS